VIRRGKLTTTPPFSYILASDKLVKQVNEYRTIQEDIKTDLRSKIQQTLLDVFMRSDKDEDFVIDPEEVDRLVTRLTNIPGVDFDEGKFRRALKKEGGDIMEFADKHFGDDDAAQKERIFKF
jgi:cell division FtsZ-interacting protein ZapD